MKYNMSYQKLAAARFLLAFLVLLAVLILPGGCALTESGGRLALEELPDQEARLAGVFVTRTPIEPGPPSLELNSRGELVVKDTGSEKIYGSFTGYDAGAAVVTFPDLEGYGIYSLAAPEDDTHMATGNRYIISDPPFANSHYNFSDQDESIETDLYIGTGSYVLCCFNPVYQQADGQIYVLAGSGVSSDSFVNGEKFSHSISESKSLGSKGEESSRTLRFSVNIIGSGVPQETELYVMDGENRLLERYGEEQLEKFNDAGTSLTLPKEASYLILLQTIEGNEHDSRRLFDRNAESVEYMASAGDGILYFRQLPLTWP